MSRHTYFVDAHVHIHRCFALDECLTAAAINVLAAGRRLGVTPQAVVLLLTEQSGVDEFARVLTRDDTGDWQVDGYDELTIRMAHSELLDTVLIPGRQIVCRERLEVLALGTRSKIADDQPIIDVLRQVEQTGAIPVLPWGFGKWSGSRGRLVAQLIAERPVESLWLGDNAARLRGLPGSPLFGLAARSGMHILPGTDPFPFRREASRVGRYGFMLDVTDNRNISGKTLLELIRAQVEQPAVFGQLESPIRFVCNQVRMQLRNSA